MPCPPDLDDPDRPLTDDELLYAVSGDQRTFRALKSLERSFSWRQLVGLATLAKLADAHGYGR